MKLHDLKPDAGSKRKRNRVGRGISAGQGKTAGRGTKGQGSRSGKNKRPSFEGGQLPLVRRLPFKRGFTNIFKITYQPVNVGDLSEWFDAGTTVTPAMMAAIGMLRDADTPVVILGDGEVAHALTVQAHRFSKSAAEKITAAGGTVTRLELLVKGARATVKKLSRAELAKLAALRDANPPAPSE